MRALTSLMRKAHVHCLRHILDGHVPYRLEDVPAIPVSGVHRLGANCFQDTYEKLVAEGIPDQEARGEVAIIGDHIRTEVTYNYVPRKIERVYSLSDK